MATVINRITKQVIRSAHTPDYPTDEWIINPDLPECQPKWWKIVGDEVLEMSQSEKDIITQAEQAQSSLNMELAKDIDMLETLNRALALVVLDEINLLRVEAGLSERTVEQLRTSVKNKYDTL
jgi:hypothetical protein